MAQQAKAFATEAWQVELTPGTHAKKIAPEKQLFRIVL